MDITFNCSLSGLNAMKVTQVDFYPNPNFLIEVWQGSKYDQGEERKNLRTILLNQEEARTLLLILQKAFF
jgi:hypothetical protein